MTHAQVTADTTVQGNSSTTYVSSTGGGLWKAVIVVFFPVMIPISDSLPGSPSVGAFVAKPGDTAKIIVATGDYARFIPGTGIYRSLDGGDSWTECTLPSGTPTYCYRAIADEFNPNHVLIATDAGLYRTTNFGTSWTRILTDHCTDVIQDFNTVSGTSQGYIWYAGVRGKGVYRSTSFGSSFGLIGTGISTTNLARITLNYCRNTARYVYALCEGDSGPSFMHGVYRSTNWGDGTWTSIKAVDDLGSGQAFHTGAVAVNPANPAHVIVGFAGGSETFNATSATPTWSAWDGGHADYRYMYWRRSDNVLVICNDGGIYTKDYAPAVPDLNGTINLLGLNCMQVMQPANSLSVARTNPNKLYCGLQDNGMIRFNIGGSPVIEYFGGGDGGASSVSADNSARVAFTSGYAFGRYWSPDSGTTKNNILGSGWETDWGPGPTAWAHQINFDQSPGDGTYIYAVDNRQTYYRTTASASWTAMSATTCPVKLKTVESVADPTVNAWYVSEWGGGRVYVLTGPRGSCTYDNRTPAGQVLKSDCIVEADKSTTEGGTVYYTSATSSPQAAFVSYNYGVNWTNVLGDIPTKFPGARLWHLRVMPDNHSTFFMSTNFGIIRSDNGGANWYKYMKGFPAQNDVQSMEISYDNAATGTPLAQPLIRIGTYGRGFWERKIELAPTRTVRVGFYNSESVRVSYSGRVIFQPLEEGAEVSYNSGAFGNNVWIPYNVPAGKYRVWFKADHYLARAGTVDCTNGNVDWYPGSYKGGDAAEDNAVNILDYIVLSTEFGKEQGQSGYTGDADFDGDRIVSILDYLILSANYDLEGAPE